VLYNAEEFRQEGILDPTMVNRTERPSGRKRLDTALVVAAGVVLLFAVVGVVSAGTFVAGKVSGNSTKPIPTAKPATTSALVAQDIHRAQAQATAIVRQAQSAGHSIVASANAKAHRQASDVIAAARHQASSYRSSVAAAPALASTVVPNTSTSVGSATTGGVASGVSQIPTGSSVGATGGVSTGTSTGSASRASVPDLRGVPSTWLVVGYNATFASGSGSVGSISVVNRSGKTFGGVAVVKYKTGGSASASFSGLAPGQALVLPLSGSSYPGGGYRIVMSGLH
jgi:hypothetical protein